LYFCCVFSVKSIITTDQQKNTDKVPVVDMVEFHNHEQFSRLESTLTKSIGGINNLQKENTQEMPAEFCSDMLF
jgi:hypothetical protein